MNVVSHQTVRLGKGRHSSLEHGACVMELASLLAGERFSDHPRSVCRLIGAFLRGYNDMIDDDRRQDLYACAASVVGTAGPPELEILRAERLARWTDEVSAERPYAVLGRIRRCLRRRHRPTEPEACARQAVMAVRKPTDATHAAVLRLVDELVEIGLDSMMMKPAAPAAGAARSEADPVRTS